MKIVFIGKTIVKDDDFYIEEVENMTIGKTYDIDYSENIHNQVIIENVWKNSMWSIKLTIQNDIGSYIKIDSNYFLTIQEWRDRKLKGLGL